MYEGDNRFTHDIAKMICGLRALRARASTSEQANLLLNPIRRKVENRFVAVVGSAEVLGFGMYIPGFAPGPITAKPSSVKKFAGSATVDMYQNGSNICHFTLESGEVFIFHSNPTGVSDQERQYFNALYAQLISAAKDRGFRAFYPIVPAWAIIDKL